MLLLAFSRIKGKVMGKNRSIEAKRIKYIKQSKARPRTLRMNNGQMKTGQSVDRSKIPEEFLGLFQYRERAKTFIDGYLEALYPSAGMQSQGRLEALHQSLQPAKDIQFVTKLSDGRYVKVAMLATSRMDCIYFIEYHVLAGVIRRSVSYSSHERAMHVFQLQTIRWKETIHIPNVE